MNKRVDKLRTLMENEKIDGLLVTAPENRMYLSGFTGTAAILFITPAEAFLITDFRYTEQAREQSPHFTVVQQGSPAETTLIEMVKKSGAKTIGLEKENVTCNQYEFYREKLDFVSLELVKGLVESLRMVKDKAEIERLRKAITLADQAFAHIIKYIKPEVPEREIALELEFYMRKKGAEKAAFDFIAASGERSAMPHGVASSKTLKTGEFLTMDYGCVFAGYHSDITRTVVLGQADDKQKEIYHIVLEAQLAAIKAVKPGLKGQDIDKIARDIISEHGFGENFGHSLGHSVGLEIHEKPSFSPNDETILEEGMTITVEPGIYISGWGGVRIEDIVLVTGTGCEVLTRADKKLLEINT